MNANLNTLSPATLTLLAKAVADAAKDAREALPVGANPVSETVTLTVNGKVTVGEDYEQRIVAKADPWLLLAAAMSHLNGVTMESITREALTCDPALVLSLKAQAATCIEAVKAPTMTACNGKVTTKGTVTVEVATAPVAIAA